MEESTTVEKISQDLGLSSKEKQRFIQLVSLYMDVVATEVGIELEASRSARDVGRKNLKELDDLYNTILEDTTSKVKEALRRYIEEDIKRMKARIHIIEKSIKGKK